MQIETTRLSEIKDLDKYKNFRDELISKAVKDINDLRKGTPFERTKETKKNLSIRINSNPHISGIDGVGELKYILDECRNVRSYKKLYWLLK